MKVGVGFDVHRYAYAASATHIMVGGVAIPFDRSVVAHSDGDVLIHSLCDALLGGAGLEDIGHHFPESDDTYRGVDSRILLRRVAELVARRGFHVGNTDSVIIAQAPRIAPHIEAMRTNLAEDLGVDRGAINLKATTSEGLGFIGREEGIAAQTVVLLE